MAKTVMITLVKSPIGRLPKQRATLKALGLTKLNKTIDKIQNRYRWRIIIKGNISKEANEILNACIKEIYQENIKDTRIAIDINPNNMS